MQGSMPNLTGRQVLSIVDRNMEGNSEIRLDPDAAGPDVFGDGLKTPLCDLYELPVFAADTWRKAGECRREEIQKVEGFREGIFDVDGRDKKEWIRTIQSQIFQTVPEHPALEYGSPGLPSDGFTPPGHSMSDIAGESQIVPGVFLLLGLMVIGMSLAGPRRKGRRKG